MRKRYCENTLMKNRKKKGSSILVRAVILMICCGMLSGCSTVQEAAVNEDGINEDAENISDQPKTEEIRMDQLPVDDFSAGNDALEETIMLAFMKGGEQEQKKAVLTAGDGYYIYLPENEWQPSGSDLWTASVNEQVRFWITHFEAESMNSVDQKLENDGYEAEQGFHKWRQEGDIIYHVELKEAENEVWGVFYCYPTDAEEGWGREMPVIADTFVISAEAGNEKNNNSDNVNEYPGAGDSQEIENVVNEFAAAYFNGDTEGVQKYLASTYDGEIDIYDGTGTISNLTMKGISDAGRGNMENEGCTASLEFRDSNYEDMFMYLTFVLIKEDGSWKIQFYGMEG